MPRASLSLVVLLALGSCSGVIAAAYGEKVTNAATGYTAGYPAADPAADPAAASKAHKKPDCNTTNKSKPKTPESGGYQPEQEKESGSTPVPADRQAAAEEKSPAKGKPRGKCPKNNKTNAADDSGTSPRAKEQPGYGPSEGRKPGKPKCDKNKKTKAASTSGTPPTAEGQSGYGPDKPRGKCPGGKKKKTDSVGLPGTKGVSGDSTPENAPVEEQSRDAQGGAKDMPTAQPGYGNAPQPENQDRVASEPPATPVVESKAEPEKPDSARTGNAYPPSGPAPALLPEGMCACPCSTTTGAKRI